MNKKIIICLFSFFSITLIGSEQEMKVKVVKKRYAAEEKQHRGVKKRKKGEKEYIEDRSMESKEASDVFSFQDLKSKLEEIRGNFFSLEEAEQLKKESHAQVQRIRQVDKHLGSAKKEALEIAKEHNLVLMVTDQFDLEAGFSLIATGKALKSSDQQAVGKKIEKIGLDVIFWEPRKKQELNNAITTFLPQSLDKHY